MNPIPKSFLRLTCFLFLAALSSAFIGCSPANPGILDELLAERVQSEPVMKDGRPFLWMELAPALDKLKGLSTSDREAYVLKRALLLLLETVPRRPEYQDKDHFVVKIVTKCENDEYNRRFWPSGLEVALLEIDRSAFQALKPADVRSLSSKQLTDLFAVRELFLENIDKASQN